MDIFRHIFVEPHKNYKTKTKKLSLMTYFTKKIVVLAAGVSLLFTVGPSLASWATLEAPTEAPEAASVAPLSDSAGSPWGTPPAGSTLNEILVNGSNNDYLTANSRWSDEGKYDATFYNNMLQEYVKDGSYSTEETALEIGTAAEFAAFAKYVNEGNNFANKFVRLTSDIDLGGSGLNIAYQDNGDGTYNINITGTIENAWESIGTPSTNAFSGTFDGGMYSISNMYTYYGGLFYFLNGACLKNIIIQGNSVATSTEHCGALACCSVNGTTTIENCCNAANVYGLRPEPYSRSGLLGEVISGTIKIKNCCNLGDVYAMNGTLSGILCSESGSANSVVENCFSSSRLGANSSASHYGTSGIANVVTAYLDKVSFSNCYYNKDLPGNGFAVNSRPDESAGTNVKGLTTAQMQGEAARTNMPGIADAVKDDGTPLWVFSEDGYPRLGTDEIEIYKRNLDITADDTYVLQGETIPDPLTYTVTDSDTNEVLTGDILTACLTGKLAQNPAGTDLGEYQIIQNTLASKNTANAEIKNFTNGILKIFTDEVSIAKRNLDIKADDIYVLQGEAIPDPLTYTVTDSDTNEVLTGDILTACLNDGKLEHDAPSTPELKSYNITQGTLASKNTENAEIKNFTNGILKIYTDEFSIAKRNLDIKADDTYVLQGEAIPDPLTYTVTDLSLKEVLTGDVLTACLTGKLAHNAPSTPELKSYNITQGTLKSKNTENAEIKNFTNGILRIYTDEFSVNPKNITNNEQIKLSLNPTSGSYTGSAHSPTVTVTDSEITVEGNAKTLAITTDYKVSKPTDMTTVGDKTITVTGAGNYTGSKNATYTITASTENIAVTLSPTTFTYDGASQKPTVTVKDGNTTLTEGANNDYTVTWPEDTISAGIKTVTVTLNEGKYGQNQTKTASYKIVIDATYGDKIGDKLEYGNSLKSMLGEPKFADGSSIPGEWDWSRRLYDKDGEEPHGKNTFVGNVTAAGETRTFTVEFYPSTEQGRTYLTSIDKATEIKGENGQVIATAYLETAIPFTVAKKDVTVTATAASKTYGEAEPASFAYTNTALAGTEALSGALARAAGENAGEYNITQGTLTNANNPNYNITFVPAKFTINKKALTVTADNKTQVYGATQESLTYSAPDLISGDILTGSLKINKTANFPNVGTYDIVQDTAFSNSNYNITFNNGTYTISAPASGTVEVTLSAASFTYNGNVQKPSVTSVKYNDTTLTASDYDLDIPSDSKNADTYTVTATLKGNYSSTLKGTANYTINKKDVTVTADNKTQVYGETELELTKTVSGLVGSDSLTGSLKINKTANFPNVGTYDIVQDTAFSNSNYNITFNNGTYTINKKALTATGMTVSLDSSSGTYTGSPHNPTITVKDGTSILTKDTHYTVALPTDMTNVGNKTITITGTGNYNGTVTKIYTITQEDGTTSVIISPETTDRNGIVWLLEESDGTSAWYGIDNRANTFVSGSRFYVQWLNTREHPEAFADIDEETRQQVEENRGWLFRIGVIAPDGTRYSTLPTPVNVYVQIGDDWDKDDLRGFYIQAGEDESVEVTYVEGMPYPEGFDEFGVMKLRHFSPYFIYDELTEAEKAALGSSKKDETVLTTETDVNGGQTQVIVRDPNGVLPSGTKVIAVVDSSDNIYKIWLVDETGNSIPMPLSTSVEVSVEIPDGIDKDVFKDRLSKAGENGHFDKFGERWYVTITSNYFPIQIYLGELTDEEKSKISKSIESSGQPKSGQEENTSNNKALVHEASAEENSNNSQGGENNNQENENISQWLNLSSEQITYISAATASFLVLLILFILISAKRKKKNNK